MKNASETHFNLQLKALCVRKTGKPGPLNELQRDSVTLRRESMTFGDHYHGKGRLGETCEWNTVQP